MDRKAFTVACILALSVIVYTEASELPFKRLAYNFFKNAMQSKFVKRLMDSGMGRSLRDFDWIGTAKSAGVGRIFFGSEGEEAIGALLMLLLPLLLLLLLLPLLSIPLMLIAGLFLPLLGGLAGGANQGAGTLVFGTGGTNLIPTGINGIPNTANTGSTLNQLLVVPDGNTNQIAVPVVRRLQRTQRSLSSLADAMRNLQEGLRKYKTD